MYHAETDTPAMARTSNLNEELGQVREREREREREERERERERERDNYHIFDIPVYVQCSFFNCIYRI